MDSTKLIKSIIGSVVRWLIQGAVGYLVAKEVITQEQGAELIIAIIGGIIVLMWALWQKYHVEQKIRLALSLPPDTPRAVLEKKIDEEGAL